MDARPPLQQRLVQLWTWLPAFRAVAEVQHVQNAARQLHVTPSSLSRAIRLLEEHLGKRVFDRVGRNVRLNHDGEDLLAAVRDAMRGIDDAIARVTGTVFTGELRVACEGDQPLVFVWRAAARLRKRYDGLRTSVEEVPAKSDLAVRLLSGELDVALVTLPPRSPRLLVEHLADVTYGIYCGVGHPLHRRRTPTMEEIQMHAFVAPISDAQHGPSDQWPRALERIVALRLPALEPAIAVCASGELLAVLPDVAVSEASMRRSLRRLPSKDVPSSPIFAVRRRPTGDIDRAGAFVTELRADVRAMLAGAAAPTARRGRSQSRGARSRPRAP
jgi:DNA-binding transcriptional LysR family regulator